MNKWAFICTVGAVLFLGSALSAQTVLERVVVDPNGAALRTTLPFGEPFVVAGPASASLQRVELRTLRWETNTPRTKAGCDSAFAISRAGEFSPAPWVRPSSLADSFFVTLRPLSANNRYTLCVRTHSRITGDDLTRFQASAAGALDAATRNAEGRDGTVPPDLPQEEIARLQSGLVRTLRGLTSDSIVAPPGSVFRQEDTLPKHVMLTIGRILEVQQQANDAAEDYDEEVESVAGPTLLGGLARDRRVGSIAIRLTSKDPIAGVSAAEAARGIEVAGRLHISGFEYRRQVASGEVSLDSAALSAPVSPRTTDLWDPPVFAGRLRRLDQSVSRIQELRLLVVAIESSAELQQKVGVSGADASALLATLDEALDQLDGIRASLARLAGLLQSRRTMIGEAANALRLIAETEVGVAGTSISAFEPRARQVVTADLGLAAVGIGEVMPYFGANFYPCPLNKRVPLALSEGGEVCNWAFTIGLTATSIEKTDARDDLFANFSLLLGLGRRITDASRLTGGVLIFRSAHPNPLIEEFRLRPTPFLSASFDVDARGALGRVGDLLFK
jgi:hypothetical protein